MRWMHAINSAVTIKWRAEPSRISSGRLEQSFAVCLSLHVTFRLLDTWNTDCSGTFQAQKVFTKGDHVTACFNWFCPSPSLARVMSTGRCCAGSQSLFFILTSGSCTKPCIGRGDIWLTAECIHWLVLDLLHYKLQTKTFKPPLGTGHAVCHQKAAQCGRA